MRESRSHHTQSDEERLILFRMRDLFTAQHMPQIPEVEHNSMKWTDAVGCAFMHAYAMGIACIVLECL